jgi:signal peptidase I
MILRWFISPTVRQACAMRNHVHHLLCAQRDVLTPPAIGGVTLAMNQLQAAIAEGTNKGRIRIKMDELDFAANKWLKPYPNALWRENVEVILVAVAVAMAIRTFFVQPFKIPTGSMQPTLFGVVSKNYLPHDGRPGDSNFKIPTGWERVK